MKNEKNVVDFFVRCGQFIHLHKKIMPMMEVATLNNSTESELPPKFCLIAFCGLCSWSLFWVCTEWEGERERVGVREISSFANN